MAAPDGPHNGQHYRQQSQGNAQPRRLNTAQTIQMNPDLPSPWEAPSSWQGNGQNGQRQQAQEVLAAAGIFLPNGSSGYIVSHQPQQFQQVQYAQFQQPQHYQHQQQQYQAESLAQTAQQLHQMDDQSLMQLFSRSLNGQQAAQLPSPVPSPQPSYAEEEDEEEESSGSDSEGSDYGMTDVSYDSRNTHSRGPSSSRGASNTARERRDAERGTRPRKVPIASAKSTGTGGSYEDKSSGAAVFAVTTGDDPDVSWSEAQNQANSQADCF
jgi:hypothetical protein